MHLNDMLLFFKDYNEFIDFEAYEIEYYQYQFCSPHLIF